MIRSHAKDTKLHTCRLFSLHKNSRHKISRHKTAALNRGIKATFAAVVSGRIIRLPGSYGNSFSLTINTEVTGSNIETALPMAWGKLTFSSLFGNDSSIIGTQIAVCYASLQVKLPRLAL